jgi:hypothetical protein
LITLTQKIVTMSKLPTPPLAAYAVIKGVSALTLSFALVLQAGCNQTENARSGPTGQPEVTSGAIAKAAALPVPIPASDDLMKGIADGQGAQIVLDKCPQPPPETLGSLICGQSYQVSWDAATSRWVARGPNKVLPLGDGYDVTLAKYPGPKPSERVMVVWGLWLTIKPDLSVQMEKGPVIGTLQHIGVAATPETAPISPTDPAITDGAGMAK